LAQRGQGAGPTQGFARRLTARLFWIGKLGRIFQDLACPLHLLGVQALHGQQQKKTCDKISHPTMPSYMLKVAKSTAILLDSNRSW
jgi:hypothetical protein